MTAASQRQCCTSGWLGDPVRVTIVSRIWDPEPAAASQLLAAVASTLVERGHDVLVLTATPPPGLTVGDDAGALVKRARVLRNRDGYVRGYLQYLSFDIPVGFRLLSSRRADVILVEPPPTTGAVVRVAATLRRTPVVYDAADIWSDAATMATSSRVILAGVRALERFAIRGAARVVTISDGVVQRMRALGVSTPATVVGFGADTTRFSPVAVPPRNEFVYAGSYSVWHGADVFVRAFALFAVDHPGWRLRFIGNGSERESLIALADELGISDRVSHEAPIAPSALATILSAAAASLASVLPDSGYEYAVATKAYSSLACGCPVIFAGAGPTSELVESASAAGNAGIAVPHDAHAVAVAMAQIAGTPIDAQDRATIAAWMREHASLQTVARRIAVELESVGERAKP